MKPAPMLLMPGPTPVPAEVLSALAQHPIGHRSEAFKTLFRSVSSQLKTLFHTHHPVFIYSASATGAMEAALINTVNPGEAILVLSCGVFSHRWADIAHTLGMTVHLLEVPYGQAHTPEDVDRFFQAHRELNLKAVCLIHNETSTGVLNPLETLITAVKRHTEALILVDAVTSLGATPFEMDRWHVDVAVSGSQKGFMLPPGLSFLGASPRAMAAHQACTQTGYYFRFSAYQKALEQGQTPYTPAVTLIAGLHQALTLMEAEGFEAAFARHHLNQQMTRAAMRAMKLTLFIDSDALASPATTAICPPDGMSADGIRQAMRKQFDISLAGGQKGLQGRIFRIGHLGAVFPRDILTVVSCLETICHQLGYKHTPWGTAVAAAQEVYGAHG